MRRPPSWLRRTLAAWAAAVGLVVAAPAATAPNEAAASQPAEVLVLFRAPPPHFRAGSDYQAGYSDKQGRAARRRLAREIAQARGLTLVTDWPMPVLGLDCYVMRAPPGRSADEVARELSGERNVAWAEPMNLYRGRAAAHNDPLFAVQPAARLWRLGELHEIATGRNVRVAEIDSQVDVSHPDLRGQIALARDFVPDRPALGERHGTGVAGVIAARADNGLGIVGVAPGARLMALRACWQSADDPAVALCDSLSLAKALVFAIDHKAQVINLSLSGPPTLLLGKLIDVAGARGAAVVGAYDRALPAGGFPASHPGVIAVADAGPAPASVFLAPGSDIPVPEPGGRWGLVDGSSYAAAHVSGLVALLRQGGRVSRASLALTSDSGGPRAIDPCASLLRAFGPCACGCGRVADAAPRRR
ncbi:S8 family serine peptidase [Phenylobacterium sp. LjRoot225]|uniref:S8 family peptidase n=1 Tax=Phenylobacterium sp. LjRoot225 TaxID=3342285 RepID=UPI003ED048F1